MLTDAVLAQRPERRAQLLGEELRLLPRREVTALVDLVEVDELGIGALGPAPRRLVDLAGKHRHGDRDRDLAVFCSTALKLLLLFSQ